MAFQLKSVLLLDGIDKVCQEILQNAGIQVTTSAKLSKDELVQELKKHDAMVVRSATKVTAEVLEQCGHLKVVGRAGTGVDNIDVKAATKNGVLVMNTPGGNTLSAAEHTCALICSLSRAIPLACASLKAGAWDRKKLMGNELYGKTLAIIGLGRIGREVSSRMKSFGMTVIGFDPMVNAETAAEWGIKYQTLDQIWPQADYITVHTPLIPQTRNLIGTSSLAACKPTVKIVNVARGGIVDEKALFKALCEDKCGGAGLDVFEEEPPKDLTLVQHPKVICTPHLGANTFEAQKRVAVEIAQQFIEMSTGKPLFGVINAPALAMAGSDEARPWIKLAYHLGSLATQFMGAVGKPASFTLSITGATAESLSGLFKPAILHGVVSQSHPAANLINAGAIAEAVGSSYTQATKSVGTCGFTGLTLEAAYLDKKVVLRGMVLGSSPVLVSVSEKIFEPYLMLSPNMLFFLAPTTNEPMAEIVSALQGQSLTSITSAKSASAETVVVATTAVQLSSIPTLSNVTYAART